MCSRSRVNVQQQVGTGVVDVHNNFTEVRRPRARASHYIAYRMRVNCNVQAAAAAAAAAAVGGAPPGQRALPMEPSSIRIDPIIQSYVWYAIIVRDKHVRNWELIIFGY